MSPTLAPIMPPILSEVGGNPSGGRTAAEVADLLRGAIVAGELAPNERLVEQDIARDLETNRNVVRGALALLEQQRLIVREPNRGVRVRTYTAEEAAEILETRSALEGLVARRAARAIDADGERKLRELLSDMRACHDRGDLLAYSQLNGKLHRTISEIGHHDTASMLLASLQSQAVRYQFRTVLQPGRITQSLAEHTAIVDALAAHDEDAAERAMRAHIGAVMDTVLAIGGSDTNALKAI